MRKDEIITALKTKYLGFALSNEAIDRIASAKEKTVTDDTDIEALISDVATMELVANEVKKNADKERRLRSDLQKSFDDYKQSHPDTRKETGEDEKKETNEDQEVPEWAKELREQNKELTRRLDEQDKSAKQKAILAAALSFAKENGCTDEKGLKLTQALFRLKDDESEEDASNRFKAEYDATMKDYFGDGVTPYKGSIISTPAKVSDADKATKAREDAKRVRES